MFDCWLEVLVSQHELAAWFAPVPAAVSILLIIIIIMVIMYLSTMYTGLPCWSVALCILAAYVHCKESFAQSLVWPDSTHEGSRTRARQSDWISVQEVTSGVAGQPSHCLSAGCCGCCWWWWRWWWWWWGCWWLFCEWHMSLIELEGCRCMLSAGSCYCCCCCWWWWWWWWGCRWLFCEWHVSLAVILYIDRIRRL